MTGLEEVLAEALGAPVAIRASEPHLYRSTFGTFVVACEVAGERQTLFCKVGPTVYESGHGHRGGVAREAAVYRLVLAPRRLGPPFRGAAERGGETWLVLEHLGHATRLVHASEPPLLPAARWAAAFHALEERARPAFVPAYDRDYYLGWSRRARALGRAEGLSGAMLARLDTLCDRYEAAVPALLAAPQTLIHGEYGPKNILVDEEAVWPVDWESAACAPGEIDLAGVVHGWDELSVRAAAAAYREVRWPEGAPAEHPRTFAAARLYWLLRWLGDDELWEANGGFGDWLGEIAVA